MRASEKYDGGPCADYSSFIPIAAAALALAACGSEGIAVSDDDPEDEAGAVLFAEHCAGCHTLSAAGTQGSGNRSLRAQGPNLDQREATTTRCSRSTTGAPPVR